MRRRSGVLSRSLSLDHVAGIPYLYCQAFEAQTVVRVFAATFYSALSLDCDVSIRIYT